MFEILKRNKILAIIYRSLVRPFFTNIKNCLIFFLSAIDVLYFLIANYKIFNNQIIYIHFHHSFGHQVVGYDWAARLYWPNKVSLIEIIQPKNNKYLSSCYLNFDSYGYNGIFYKEKYSNGLIVYRLLRFWIGLICAVNDKSSVIDFRTIYRTLSPVPFGKKICIGTDQADKKCEYSSTIGRFQLLRAESGPRPNIPPGLKQNVEELIRKKYPKFFDKPFITILLRKKEVDSTVWVSRERTPKNQKNYRKAVKFISDMGYNIVGTGETDPEFFNDINGYFDLNNIGIEYGLINLYLMSECTHFIGQQSGPITYINSVGIPSLLTDFLPHWSGTANCQDMILHKVFLDDAGKNEISLQDMLLNYRDLFYAVGVNRHIVRDNTEDEILLAVKEFLSADTDPAYTNKLANYHRNIPSDTVAHYSKNRVPSFML